MPLEPCLILRGLEPRVLAAHLAEDMNEEMEGPDRHSILLPFAGLDSSQAKETLNLSLLLHDAGLRFLSGFEIRQRAGLGAIGAGELFFGNTVASIEFRFEGADALVQLNDFIYALFI